jgi:phospholipid/cholesterol/gamma-HCH transport system substrate-binding protein
MRSVSGVGRTAAIGAVVVGVIVVALVMFGAVGGTGYTVKAEFLSAAQLVKGNEVQIGGTKVGSVKQIDITPDGRALVTMQVQKAYAPLRRGTKAIIRQASLSGIANRMVDLQMPAARSTPAGETQEEIPDGGTISVDETQTAVDLDEVFNIFDPPTRYATQQFFKGSRRQWAHHGEEANRGFQYLSPSLSASRRLFNELNADTPLLERFVIDSAKFMTAVAERRNDLAALVANLNSTFRALGNDQVALREAIEGLPPLMRSANTTFVNLRATLDDVDPLVDASKPVVRRLRHPAPPPRALGPCPPGAGCNFLGELRQLVDDARPTVRNLNLIVRRKGRNNDLLELNRTLPPLADIALEEKRRSVNFGGGRQSVGEVQGAFPENVEALESSSPLIAQGRPYTPDLFGWFDDFSNTGQYDALGGISRTQGYFNFQTASTPPFPCPTLPGSSTCVLTNVPMGVLPPPFDGGFSGLELRDEVFRENAKFAQWKRCPGASEDDATGDGSNVWSPAEQDELDCRETDRATGEE